MGIPRKMILVILGIFIFGGITSAYTVRITSVNLRRFPRIRVILSVSDAMGRPVPIDPREVRLFENNRPVSAMTIKTLDQVEIPVYTVIIMDRSGSMRGRAISRARDGAAAFVARMRSGDHSAFVCFDTRVDVASHFSDNRTRLKSAIRATRTGSDTALLDAVFQGLKLFSEIPDHSVRAALVLTDGRDNQSAHTIPDIREMARRFRVSIFTIGLGDKAAPQILRQLASVSGGRYYAAPGPEALVKIYTQVSTLLHARLVVDFTSTIPMDRQWHDLNIEIRRGNTLIRGHRAYLSALKSVIPTEKLREIDAGQRKMSHARQEALKAALPSKQRHRRLVPILALILFALVLTLIFVLRRTRTRRH